jgi:hypothetical protein
VTLNLKATAKAARFEYTDGSMEVSWTVDGSLKDQELVERLRSIVAFMDAQTGGPALGVRVPGFALGMAQTAHPEPVDPDAPISYQPVAPVSGNGWAGMPSLPPRLEGEVEFIPPEEQS